MAAIMLWLLMIIAVVVHGASAQCSESDASACADDTIRTMSNYTNVAFCQVLARADVEKVGDFCKAYDHSEACIKNAVRGCGDSASRQGTLVGRYLLQYRDMYRRLCDAGAIRGALKRRMLRANNDQCYNKDNNTIDDMESRCRAGLHHEINRLNFSDSDAEERSSKRICRFVVGAENCRKARLRRTSCEEDAKHLLVVRDRYCVPGPWERYCDPGKEEAQPTAPRLRDRIRDFVSVAGDPHLKVYNRTDIQTCRAEGVHVLLENQYFRIQGAFAAVPGSPRRATFLQRVNIILYNNETGEELGSFAGEDTSVLPSTFANGAKKVGRGTGTGMEVAAAGAGRRWLRNARQGALCLVRRSARNGWLALRCRLARQLIAASWGLLVTGCTDDQEEDLSQINDNLLRRRKRRSADCSACSSLSAENQAACQYDCVEAGDNKAAETFSEQQTDENEMLALDEEYSDAQTDRDGNSNAASTTVGGLALSLILVQFGFYLK